MGIAGHSTVEALEKARKRYKSFDAVIDVYGIKTSKGTLSRMARGESVSDKVENEVRTKLGLPPRFKYEVDPCPSCGLVHTGDCKGKPVVTVACLAPGEQVVNTAAIAMLDEWMAEDKAEKSKRRRQHYYRPCLSLDPAERLEQLRRMVSELEEQ